MLNLNLMREKASKPPPSALQFHHCEPGSASCVCLYRGVGHQVQGVSGVHTNTHTHTPCAITRDLLFEFVRSPTAFSMQSVFPRGRVAACLLLLSRAGAGTYCTQQADGFILLTRVKRVRARDIGQLFAEDLGPALPFNPEFLATSNTPTERHPLQVECIFYRREHDEASGDQHLSISASLAELTMTRRYLIQRSTQVEQLWAVLFVCVQGQVCLRNQPS